MKTIFRILIILVVATLIGGLMYVGVSASDSTAGFDDFEEGEGRPPQGGEFHDEGEHGGERDERGGFGFPGGILKSLMLMTIAGGIYSVIVWAGKKARQTTTN